MTLKQRLIEVATEFARARGLSMSRVSTLAFKDGKVLDRLMGAGDITTGRYEAGLRWFSEHWPKGANWPAKVTRPSKSPSKETAA